MTVFIVFNSKKERGKGILALARHTRIYGLRGGLYGVPEESLKLLDALCIGYRQASEEEVEGARGPVRDPAAAVL